MSLLRQNYHVVSLKSRPEQWGRLIVCNKQLGLWVVVNTSQQLHWAACKFNDKGTRGQSIGGELILSWSPQCPEVCDITNYQWESVVAPPPVLLSSTGRYCRRALPLYCQFSQCNSGQRQERSTATVSPHTDNSISFQVESPARSDSVGETERLVMRAVKNMTVTSLPAPQHKIYQWMVPWQLTLRVLPPTRNSKYFTLLNKIRKLFSFWRWNFFGSDL